MRRFEWARATRRTVGRQRMLKRNAAILHEIINRGSRKKKWADFTFRAKQSTVCAMHMFLAGCFTGLSPAVGQLVGNIWRSNLLHLEDLAYLAPLSTNIFDPSAQELLSKFFKPSNDLLINQPTPELLHTLTSANLSHLNLDFSPPTVYLIFKPGNTAFYVGSTHRPMIQDRLREHVTEARSAQLLNKPASTLEPKVNHMKKLGAHSFVMIPLIITTLSSLRATEYALINYLTPHLNSSFDFLRGLTSAGRSRRQALKNAFRSRLPRLGLGSATHVLDMEGESRDPLDQPTPTGPQTLRQHPIDLPWFTDIGANT